MLYFTLYHITYLAEKLVVKESIKVVIPAGDVVAEAVVSTIVEGSNNIISGE